MKTIPPSTFPQYSNGSAPLLRKVERINGGYSLTRHNAFSWLAPRFNVTQMSLRTDSNLLFAPYDITRNKKRPLSQHCEPHLRSSNLNFFSPTIGVRFRLRGFFVYPCFSLFHPVFP